MNILIIGHVCIDENTSEKVSYKNWGSPLMYMAKYLQTQPDTEVTLLAPYGEDFLGYLRGIHMANKPMPTPTLLYRNESTGAGRMQSTENSQLAGPVEITNQLAGVLSAADILILAPLLQNYKYSYVKNLFEYLSRDCVTVLSPQGYLRKVDSDGQISYQKFSDAHKIVPLFDMVVASNEDMPDAANELTAWSQLAKTTNIIMTEGEKGASIIKNGKLTQVTTNAVPSNQIIDSVGCGDIFTAATAYNYFQTRDLLSAVRSGNEAAGKRLRHKIS